MRRLPRWASRLVAVLACVLLPLGILSTWAAAVVSDTDTYVETVGPLAENPLVQRAAIRKLETLALDAIDVDKQRGRLEDLLEQRDANLLVQLGALALADRAAERLDDVVHEVVTRVVESEQFPEAWTTANRSAHEELVRVLEAQDSEFVDSDGRISLPLATVLNVVLQTLVENGFVDAASAPTIPSSFTLLETKDVETIRGYYQLLTDLGFWLPVAWFALVVLVLLFARDRRDTVGWLAYGSILSLGVLAWVLGWGQERAVSHLGDPTDQALADAVMDSLLFDLRASLQGFMVITLGILLLRWVTGPSRPAVSLRTSVGGGVRTLREREDLEIVRGVMVTVLVLAFLWWVF